MNKASNTVVCNTSSISPVSTSNSNVITVQTSLPNLPPMSVNNDNKRNQVLFFSIKFILNSPTAALN